MVRRDHTDSYLCTGVRIANHAVHHVYALHDHRF